MNPVTQTVEETAQASLSMPEETWKIVRDLLAISEWLTQEHNTHE